MDKKSITSLLGLVVFLSQITFSYAFTPPVKFRFPISNMDRKLMGRYIIFGVDHNPKDHKFDAICKNYKGRGFPLCYDGHRGTDFMLKGGFRTMDRGSAAVVAAESGVVTYTVDGNYDRCRINFFKFKVTCKGHAKRANYVKIKHDDGTSTRYLHLKKGSIVVKVGQRVSCGQKLGLIGSSGNSSAPHLHFEVIDQTGKHRDPYAGKKSQPESFWKIQKAKDRLPSGDCVI